MKKSEAVVPVADFSEPEKISPRERIFQAALACFARQGVRRTNMEAVAREAGVSRPAIYYYFKDKQSLIVEVVLRQQAEAYRRRSERFAGSLHGLEAIIEAAALGVEGAIGNPYIALLTRPESEQLTAIALHSEMARKVQAGYWGPLLNDAQQRGELRNDLSHDEIILWIIFLQFQLVVHGHLIGCTDRDSIRGTLDRFLLPALRPSADAPLIRLSSIK